MDAKEKWKNYCNGRCYVNKKENKRCNVSCGLCELIFMSAYHSRDKEVKQLDNDKNWYKLKKESLDYEIKHLKELLEELKDFFEYKEIEQECPPDSISEIKYFLLNKINEVLNNDK